MAIDLSRVKEQDALRAQREPVWQRIQPGCFLGYRPSAREGARTWIARAYDEGQRRYHLKALGDFGTLPGRERFADAKKAAEAFAILLESGGQPAERIDTVEDACRRYLETHPDVVGRVTCGIFSDPIASVKLTKLSIGVQKGPPIGVQKGPPSSSSVTGMTGALFVLVAA